MQSVSRMLIRLVSVGLIATMLAACSGAPQKAGGRVVDPSTVRVSGSVERDFDRALELLRGERYPEAIELLQDIVQREQRLPAPYINLGIAYYQSGDEKHAEESLLQALEVFPNHPVAANELAVLFRRQGRFEEARELFGNAQRQNPDYAPLIKNFGILCDLYLQDPQCALAQFERYLQLEPEDKDVPIWVAGLKRRI
ncbi:photosystem I assembly protein Ycf3 [Microbulbifer aggregans]|uniref:Photosystem I assembly protein Ycf3 n=2 Tax=Microbulbifer aggregans TaxID=1769779 RepID=A0A1C9W7E1_9GAMM|nr:photosystem I assembly protein Ycf3 [Microbulbifer aggregans]